MSVAEPQLPQTPLLSVLRVVELKGRVRATDVATPLDIAVDAADALLTDLEAAGLLTKAGAGYRLADEGRARLAELLAADASAVDQPSLAAAYDDFCVVNADLKTIVTAWQLRADGTPNDHTDAAYDAGVLARLAELHQKVLPLVERLAAIAPRLARYPARLQHAQDRLAEGDTTWVARPILDSYHTVWFELHEDLIQLSGRTRLEEAVAGRAH
ncbi:MarR family transcriptional regulator [Nocardioides albidus]|uniref:MarR family transcriptional regulator n=1 Tax=Nocardioides albidus TaxID=1517589 RepID=A0A5C4WJ69_9ACTN|nr:MarR family transcriptional regulator [Nocardioides albidus]TNM48132.1 MarR family transcriptional regulator [Nocardioides albidus]